MRNENLFNYFTLKYEAARGAFKQLEAVASQFNLEFSTEAIGVVKRKVMVFEGEWKPWGNVYQDTLILRHWEIEPFMDAFTEHLRKVVMDRILTISSHKDRLENQLEKLREQFGDYEFVVEPHETRFKTVLKMKPDQKVSEPDFQKMSSIAAGQS